MVPVNPAPGDRRRGQMGRTAQRRPLPTSCHGSRRGRDDILVICMTAIHGEASRIEWKLRYYAELRAIGGMRADAFSLTPALYRWERENSSPRGGKLPIDCRHRLGNDQLETRHHVSSFKIVRPATSRKRRLRLRRRRDRPCSEIDGGRCRLLCAESVRRKIRLSATFCWGWGGVHHRDRNVAET